MRARLEFIGAKLSTDGRVRELAEIADGRLDSLFEIWNDTLLPLPQGFREIRIVKGARYLDKLQAAKTYLVLRKFSTPD